MSISLRSSITPLSLTLAGIGAAVAAAILASTGGTSTQPAPAGVPGLLSNDHRGAFAKASEGFVENLGQWDAQALFLAQSPGVDTWVTKDGVVYDFHRTDSPKTGRPTPDTHRAVKRRGQIVRMEFVGGTPSQPTGEAPLQGRYNYFKGKDPDKWVTQVQRYAEARSERIYDGVEARWYFDQGRPRYDLIVAPGADPAKIRMRFEGARGVSTTGKALRLSTTLGDVEHRGLFAYQKVDGAMRQVPCSFRVSGNTASFEVGNYDSARPLVIDPIVWSTYLGGNSSEYYSDVKLDSAGNVVVAGATTSPDFPVTVGSYDTTFEGYDAYVSKLSPNGSTLLFSSFLGGTGDDFTSALTILPGGQPVLAGFTTSTNFPTFGSMGPFDATANGSYDGFVTKFSSDGTALSFSTYFGGTDVDSPYSVALSATNEVIIGGSSFSSNLPMNATVPGLDATHNGGTDGFVAKLSADGSTLVGSTFLGAAGSNSSDQVLSVGVLNTGQVLVSGNTQASGFPTTADAFDSTHNGGSDAFIVKLSADLTTLDYGTYFGGSSIDDSSAMFTRGVGNFIVSGRTLSTDLPGTATAYSGHNGAFDAYFAVFTQAGALLNTTYVGGSLGEDVVGVSFDTFGNVIGLGVTYSTNFPTTTGAPDSSLGGAYDNFVVKLSGSLDKLKYGTYIGGSGDDYPTSLLMDAGNNAFIGGISTGPDYPTTAGTFDQTFNGGTDGTLLKLITYGVLRKLQAPKNTFIGGFAIPFELALSQPAEPGDVIIPLTTNNPGKVLTTQTKVRAGKALKNLSVRTETVLSDTPAKITATYGGVSKSFNFTLKPGGLQSLKLQPTSLNSMEFGTGTVKISAPAPVDGRTVKLDANLSALVFVPSSVDIEVGQTEAVFPVFAGIIASPTNVTIIATLGTMKKTATLTVNP